MHTEMSPLMRASLDAATKRLAGNFRGVFSGETVARCVEDSYVLFVCTHNAGRSQMQDSRSMRCARSAT